MSVVVVDEWFEGDLVVEDDSELTAPGVDHSDSAQGEDRMAKDKTAEDKEEVVVMTKSKWEDDDEDVDIDVVGEESEALSPDVMIISDDDDDISDDVSSSNVMVVDEVGEIDVEDFMHMMPTEESSPSDEQNETKVC